MSLLLTPAEAAELAATPSPWRDNAALFDRPVVAVDLRGGDGGIDWRGVRTLPAVVIGVAGAPREAGGGAAHPAAHPACDVVVHDRTELSALVDAARQNPQAAVTLVQLLRLSVHLGPADALVAESLAYATLQGGSEFARWLAQRGERVRKPEADSPVLVTRDGATLHVELNRPRLHNLYNASMRDALAEALALAVADPTVASVELAGRGRSFCAGGDTAEFGSVADPAVAHLIRSAANTAPMLVALADRLRVHVHGAAVGAGCEIAAFARHVSATPDAVFRLPEVPMGLLPGAGGTVSVTRRIGRHRAAWLMLSGSSIDARTALEWGLVDEIVDQRPAVIDR